MKNSRHNAAKFFVEYFNMNPTPDAIRQAKELNHETIDCMVKYAAPAHDKLRQSESAMRKVLRYYRGEGEYNFMHIMEEEARWNARADAWSEIVSEIENLTA